MTEALAEVITRLEKVTTTFDPSFDPTAQGRPHQPHHTQLYVYNIEPVVREEEMEEEEFPEPVPSPDNPESVKDYDKVFILDLFCFQAYLREKKCYTDRFP